MTRFCKSTTSQTESVREGSGFVSFSVPPAVTILFCPERSLFAAECRATGYPTRTKAGVRRTVCGHQWRPYIATILAPSSKHAPRHRLATSTNSASTHASVVQTTISPATCSTAPAILWARVAAQHEHGFATFLVELFEEE
jgi:hypothetical protein